MIKILDLLKEEQKFDFESDRKAIVSYIDRIMKKDDKYSMPIARTFYSIITGPSKKGVAQALGFTEDQEKKWNNQLKSSAFVSNGIWSEIPINKHLARKLGPNKTLNYYVTLDKTKDNIIQFGKSMGDLNKRLQELSDTKQSPISWKTHTILDMLINHNDSLKIFYYDPDIKDDVEKVVKEWISSNSIKTGNRTHTHGVDIRRAEGGDKESFGQILSQEWEKQLRDVITKFGNKYTPEQYYEWIKKNGPEITRNVNIKYK